VRQVARRELLGVDELVQAHAEALEQRAHRGLVLGDAAEEVLALVPDRHHQGLKPGVEHLAFGVVVVVVVVCIY
jgi:hypothetical protein